MDAERKQVKGAKRTFETAEGIVLRATRRGALVVQTENARRMMRRFRKLQSGVEPEPAQDAEPA